MLLANCFFYKGVVATQISSTETGFGDRVCRWIVGNKQAINGVKP